MEHLQMLQPYRWNIFRMPLVAVTLVTAQFDILETYCSASLPAGSDEVLASSAKASAGTGFEK